MCLHRCRSRWISVQMLEIRLKSRWTWSQESANRVWCNRSVAEDGIAKEKNQDVYTRSSALVPVDSTPATCLPSWKNEWKQRLLSIADEEPTELPYNKAATLLAANRTYGAQSYLKRIYTHSESWFSSGQKLYKVVGHTPAINLLAKAGTRYCQKFVEEHITPESAGKHFMAFTYSSRAKDLNVLVDFLPDACKNKSIRSGLTHCSSNFVPVSRNSAVFEAIQVADDLIAAREIKNKKSDQDILSTLKSIPKAVRSR